MNGCRISLRGSRSKAGGNQPSPLSHPARLLFHFLPHRPGPGTSNLSSMGCSPNA
jgi:hypothetical protein